MTFHQFIQLIRKSKLVADIDLANDLSQFENTSIDPDDAARIIRLTGFLIERGRLTVWQSTQLLLGRFKGFFVDGCKLLEMLAESEPGLRRFLVEETKSRKRFEKLIRVSGP